MVRRVSGGRVVVVGGGPTGLGALRELVRLGHTDVVLLEAASMPGGLAASITDPQGFTWDRGGHVVFSHYGEFDQLLLDTMGDDVEHHDRSSFVYLDGTWVPYPFQNNLHRLPPEARERALIGLVEAQHAPRATADIGSDTDATGDTGTGPDFDTWMESMFGPGVCEMFMRPYNAKVWAWPAHLMSAQWIAERVASVDWRQAVRNVVHGRDDVAWGPNNQFAFPSMGGTGEIYRRAARTVEHLVRYDSVVTRVDVEAHELELADGSREPFDTLVWTGALDLLVGAIPQAPDTVREAATRLAHNSVTIVGLGYEQPLTDDRSWMYFPDDDVPFYRATNMAKYAAAMVPGGRTDRYSSWMTEVASSPHRPLQQDGLVDRVDAALRRVGLVAADAPLATVHIDQIERGYPVPTLGRDAALRTIQPWLAAHDVYSRGRFGAWKYELGNMDHSVKQGIDIARRIMDGTPEEAWSL
jgi:UDP-galactopyranose mutase